jgi:Pleckstrin homology domain
LEQVKSGKELLTFVFNDFLMFTTPSRPLASLNLQFLFDNKSNLQLKMYRKVIIRQPILATLKLKSRSVTADILEHDANRGRRFSDR